jgi:type 1 glutamine amidotransferase
VTPERHALVVRGGWSGHHPVETTELFIPFLHQHGFSVRIEESPQIYADLDYMPTVDLIVQSMSRSAIETNQFRGLQAAVEAGAGMAGWHGGIVASYPNTAPYLQMIGAQFVAHPGKQPDDRTGEQSDSYVPHTVNITALGRQHPITQGIADFDLVTEQYWVLHDDYLDVLATTTQAVRPWDPWHRPVISPVIWTRQWGMGRIFVSTPGHEVEILQDPNVRIITERGLLWAAGRGELSGPFN